VVFISIIQSGNAPLEDVRGMTARDSMMLYKSICNGIGIAACHESLARPAQPFD
jgi:hypothetical protein